MAACPLLILTTGWLVYDCKFNFDSLLVFADDREANDLLDHDFLWSWFSERFAVSSVGRTGNSHVGIMRPELVHKCRRQVVRGASADTRLPGLQHRRRRCRTTGHVHVQRLGTTKHQRGSVDLVSMPTAVVAIVQLWHAYFMAYRKALGHSKLKYSLYTIIGICWKLNVINGSKKIKLFLFLKTHMV